MKENRERRKLPLLDKRGEKKVQWTFDSEAVNKNKAGAIESEAVNKTRQGRLKKNKNIFLKFCSKFFYNFERSDQEKIWTDL